MKPTPLSLAVRVERWPIAGSFTISRGAKTEAVVVVAELNDGTHRGRGECVPYARYGETVEQVATAIEAMAADIAPGLDRERLQTAMPGGAARNALDCAFRDLAMTRAACAQAGVTLIEQPLPADRDDALAGLARRVPICADETVHASASLSTLVGKYDAVNIKLDKTGGLTEALAMAQQAERLGFTLMVGCMVATSLAMAPAVLVAQRARVVDLDGPLLLARDRGDGLRYEGSVVHPATPTLWG